MTAPTRTYGVSMPLSSEYPTMKDKELTEKLEETLRKYSVFETESELRHRMDVLHKINTLYKDWIKAISITKVTSGFLKFSDFRFESRHFSYFSFTEHA
jgi:poly(A) polymerase Pap1